MSNDNIIKTITKKIRTKPSLIQIAKDHEWEKTWDIKPERKITHKEISSYIQEKPFKTLAIEVLFKDFEGMAIILGIVYNKKLIVANEAEFLEKIIEETRAFNGFESFIKALSKKIVGRENFLLSGDPDLIRIGVVNHWFSVGPCLIWKKGLPKEMSINKLNEKVVNFSRVIETKHNYQGISFIYTKNDLDLYHWIKPQCGVKNERKYILDKEKVLYLLKLYYHFKVDRSN